MADEITYVPLPCAHVKHKSSIRHVGSDVMSKSSCPASFLIGPRDTRVGHLVNYIGAKIPTSAIAAYVLFVLLLACEISRLVVLRVFGDGFQAPIQFLV